MTDYQPNEAEIEAAAEALWPHALDYLKDRNRQAARAALVAAHAVREAEMIEEARGWARHGYEIGQRSCTWSDHGVAPGWLTEGHDL